MPAQPENPFIYGETLTETAFVDREEEADQLQRDLTDAQKVFLLSPRRFGKSTLIAAVFRRLEKRGIRTATVPVSNYTTYTEFLEGFADTVLRAAGPYDKIKGWIGRFLGHLRPEIGLDPRTGDLHFSFGRSSRSAAPIAAEVFALPGVIAKHSGFKLAIALDEFQQIQLFNGGTVEHSLRNAVQAQRQVGYVFAGSQPTLMEAMLTPKRPFFKAGPARFLEKIDKTAWQKFIPKQFARRRKVLTPAGLDYLLTTADLIPYDVQRLAHELWDYAELSGTTTLDVKEVALVTTRLVASHSQYYERLWEQLALKQRAVLRALTACPEAIYHEAVRREFGLGPTSSVQRALQGLQKQEIIGRHRQGYFFLDPIFPVWVKERR